MTDKIVHTEEEFFKALEDAEEGTLIVFDDVPLYLIPIAEHREKLKQVRQIIADYIKLRRKMLDFLKSQVTK